MKYLFKSILCVSLLLSSFGNTFNHLIHANSTMVDPKGATIQMIASGSATHKTDVSDYSIEYTVTLGGTYNVDGNGKVLSTNITASISQVPTSSEIQAYVKSCKTTISGKRAVTTVIVGLKLNGVVQNVTNTHTFENKAS